MASDLVRITLLMGAAWVLWVVVRKITAKSSLDNVPGPRPNGFSFIGELSVCF